MDTSVSQGLCGSPTPVYGQDSLVLLAICQSSHAHHHGACITAWRTRGVSLARAPAATVHAYRNGRRPLGALDPSSVGVAQNSRMDFGYASTGRPPENLNEGGQQGLRHLLHKGTMDSMVVRLQEQGFVKPHLLFRQGILPRQGDVEEPRIV